MTQKEKKSEWFHCNGCGRQTDHSLIHCHRNQEYSEDIRQNGEIIATVEGYYDWEMFECLGCKTVLLRSKQFCSEWWEPWTGDDPYVKTYYPPRNQSARSRPHWYDNFISIPEIQGHFILTAYEQIYALIESQQYLAAILTSRALLETIAIEHGDGDLRTFEAKLKCLRDKEFIRTKQIEHLDKVIYDAGSAAMHRSYNPSAKAVTYVLDAVEQLIHTIYIEPLVATELQAEKPSRKKG